MILESLVVGPIATNCYIIGSGPEVAIVDPGGSAAAIIETVKGRNLKPTALIATHCHADHILSLRELSEEFSGIEILCHPTEKSFLTDPEENLSMFLGEELIAPEATGTLSEGDTADLGGVPFKVIHVPGHSPGSICFYHEPEDGDPVLIAGDTVFADGIGRTDFPHSDHKAFIPNIKNKIFTLPPETMILPGHGPATTVAREKQYNPWLS